MRNSPVFVPESVGFFDISMGAKPDIFFRNDSYEQKVHGQFMKISVSRRMVSLNSHFRSNTAAPEETPESE